MPNTQSSSFNLRPSAFSRIILHVDMDYFFAQVEERDFPELKGKPVVVGADPKQGKGRGVVATCNYDARAFGIRSGMPISQAYKLCPEAVFLPPDFGKYSAASRAVMDIFRSFADRFEPVSIDEAYLDVSSKRSYEAAEELGHMIRKTVLERERLTCSVGIGPSKLVSKIAAGSRKPDGLTVVRPDDVIRFLHPRKVGVLYGVGSKTEERLNALGIKTVEDVTKVASELLVEHFGVFGHDLKAMANGVDDRDLVEDCVVKSVGRQVTFEKDTKNEAAIMGVVDSMIPEIYRELSAQNFVFRTLTFKARYEDFETHTKNKTLSVHTDSVKLLRLFARDALNHFLGDSRKIRLVGLSVHNFKEKGLNDAPLHSQSWIQTSL